MQATAAVIQIPSVQRPIAGRTGGSSSTVNMSADGNSTPTQQPINKSQTNQNNQSAFNQNAQNKEKPHRYGKYGLSTFETDERYNEFPNGGNPAVHAARYGKPNPAGDKSRETSSHTG